MKGARLFLSASKLLVMNVEMNIFLLKVKLDF